MAETAPHARCHWRSWGAEAAGTALIVLPPLWIYFAAPCAEGLIVALLWRRLSIPPCNAWRATGTNR